MMMKIWRNVIGEVVGTERVKQLVKIVLGISWVALGDSICTF